LETYEFTTTAVTAIFLTDAGILCSTAAVLSEINLYSPSH